MKKCLCVTSCVGRKLGKNQPWKTIWNGEFCFVGLNVFGFPVCKFNWTIYFMKVTKIERMYTKWGAKARFHFV